MNTHSDGIYHVVVNHEEQYSVWPEWRQPPEGWRSEGKRGSKQECLDYIGNVWTDMRPLSLRRSMTQGKLPEQAPQQQEDTGETLVQVLSTGQHPLRISLRPEASPAQLQRSLDQGVVLVTFTSTQGCTELALNIDHKETRLESADFEKGTGEVRFVGRLVLDDVPVLCEAVVDLQTMAGLGGLKIINIKSVG
ncbi:hypothetical protein CDH05_28110 [Pseudomonas lactis]|nr:hypothetical protein CDH05_28110 [Pseudomonas lactis]